MGILDFTGDRVSYVQCSSTSGGDNDVENVDENVFNDNCEAQNVFGRKSEFRNQIPNVSPTGLWLVHFLIMGSFWTLNMTFSICVPCVWHFLKNMMFKRKGGSKAF